MTVPTAPTHNASTDLVMETVRGGAIGQKLLHDVRGGCAGPDAVLAAIKGAGDGERLRGLARALQKALEGRA